MFRIYAAVTFLFLLAACSGVNHAQYSQPSPARTAKFQQWLADFKQEAAAKGISQAVLSDAFDGIDEPSQTILDADHTQPEKTHSFPDYENGIVSEKRIQEAKDHWQSHADILKKVSDTYGVQAPVILALWAVESHFGEHQGSYSVIESLSTLAFDGRRSAFFRTQLMDALLIMQNEHRPESELTGSWAGAMGQTQFMPSSFLSYAVDFDGDGKKDIWNDDADALASIANYLHQKGWNANQPWGMQVHLPDGKDWDKMRAPKTLSEWKALGVTGMDEQNVNDPDTMAKLVLPDNDPENAFLVFSNYDIIMDWNHSTYFATAIGLLSDAIGAP